MSNHTKGPWKLIEYTECGDPVADIVGSDGECKAACLNIDDARLVASAPELLEALKELLSVSTNPLHLPATKRDTENKARAAIAKAEGEA